MRKTSLCILAIAFVTVSGTLLGGDSASELKKLQGTWQFTAQEMDGKAMPEDAVKKLKITFSGDKWSVDMDGKVVQAGTHKLDGTKKPGTVDAVVTEGEGKGGTMLGIYELKGDTMKVCFDLAGKERPTSFTSKAGQFSATVQREKKKS